MPALIRAIASVAPAGACSQDRAARIAAGRCCFTARQTAWLSTRFARSLTRQRHSVLISDTGDTGDYETFFPAATSAQDRGPTTAARMREYARFAPRLARDACSQAMARAGVEAGEITHLVTVSCTGFMAPGLDTLLVKSLELSPRVQRAQLGFMGCHGAFNGMGVASAFAATRADARVLLCAVELSSLHLHYGHDRGRIIANALFADGASAYVIGPDDGTAGAWKIADTASCMLPDCEDAMTWIIGDHGFEMGLSPAVPALIQLSLRPWLASWLAARGLTIESVRSWAIHPGGPQILDAMETVLGLDRDATAISRAVLAEHGNMSSATIGFILDRMIALDCPRPCVAVGFGPGLMAEGALLC